MQGICPALLTVPVNNWYMIGIVIVIHPLSVFEDMENMIWVMEKLLNFGTEIQYKLCKVIISFNHKIVISFILCTVRFIARYTIKDLPGATKYVMSVKASGCFDSTEPCATEVQILDNTFIPKPVCTWDADYPVQGKHSSILLWY